MDKPVEQPIPPTTTTQQDLTVAGQRTVNLIWENTQSQIAKGVVGLTIFTDAMVTIILVITGREITVGQMFGVSFLNVVCATVISFYFSRTNHQGIGGIGPKATDTQPYVGR